MCAFSSKFVRCVPSVRNLSDVCLYLYVRPAVGEGCPVTTNSWHEGGTMELSPSGSSASKPAAEKLVDAAKNSADSPESRTVSKRRVKWTRIVPTAGSARFTTSTHSFQVDTMDDANREDVDGAVDMVDSVQNATIDDEIEATRSKATAAREKGQTRTSLSSPWTTSRT